MSWVAAAFVSAFFAGITSILAKCGIKQTDSDVATAIRTCVVLVFAWAMAGISGSIGTIGSIEPRSWLFLVLSGLATVLRGSVTLRRWASETSIRSYRSTR